MLFVRTRGWHLDEAHMLVDGEPVSGSIFDFALYFFHNARELLRRGSGPYFYLPKMESHLEARLWNDIFIAAQDALGVPQGSIRATVLIETILATFEMDEILYELRDHSAGLNCGRWDYIFSFIKKLAADKSVLLPDRAQVTMTTHFMRSYSRLAVKTCHRREIHAMGGMSAFIPIKSDPEANERALAQVRADKEREASDGHDGTWVAHPGLVPVAMEVFDRLMPGAEPDRPQAGRLRSHGGRPAARTGRLDYRGGAAAERRRRAGLRGGMAARHRLRAAVQPDGRRGDGGDQPRAAVAVGAPRRRACRWPPGGRRTGGGRHCG